MAKPILLFRSIWESTAEDIVTQILEHPKDEPIDILIDSPGGLVSSGWAIIAALQESKSEINMSVMGDASSMAFIMLLFADNTTTFDPSMFLIHRAASWWEDMMSEDELKDIENRNKIIRKKLAARIDETKFTEVTGKTFDDIFDMENRLDVRLNAQQAKKIGLIDKVKKIDVKKRQAIESRYHNDIAALANNSQNNIPKSKTHNMPKTLKDLIFGEKDSVLLGKIGEVQFVYSKLEKGVKIKAVGKEQASISGTFEAENKTITIVDNEITSIVEIDNTEKEIDSLKSQIVDLKKDQITFKDIKELFDELEKRNSEEIAPIKAALAEAKIKVSKPEIPEGDFIQNSDKPTDEEDLTLFEKMEMRQTKMYEDNLKERES